jgi:uncharacterized protein
MSRAALAFAVLLACTACKAEQPAEAARPTLRLVGPSVVDTLARAYRQAMPQVSVTATTAPSPIAAIEALARNEADLAVGFADAVYAAYAGTSPGNAADRPVHGGVRAISVLYPVPLILLSRPGANITGVADLRGRQVRVTGPAGVDMRFGPVWNIPRGLSSVPNAGSLRVNAVSQLVLLAFGVSPDAVRNRPIAAQAEALQAFRLGTLDAAFVTVYDSADIVSEAARAGIRFVPLEGAPVERLRTEYPFIRPLSIPAGTYGQPEALHTVGIDLVLVCRADLNEGLAYEVTKAHLNAAPHLWPATSPTGLPPDLVKSPATPIPLHDGAARYYRERELFR